MSERERLRSSLLDCRLQRSWSQEQLGERAGITRQSYAAIESGRSVPSTEVALRLARALGTSVEELFQLAAEEPEVVRVDAVGPSSPGGRRVRLATVAGRLVAHELEAGGTHGTVPADGVGVDVRGCGAEVRLFTERPPPPDLVVAGCDPAFGLVCELLRREHGVEVLWLSTGSRAALQALGEGTVHVAGTHLRDADTGVYNEPWVRLLVPFSVTRISFATWEQALLLRPGNPLGVRGVADLARPDLRFLNREPGSGSRHLLELRLAEAGIPSESVPGFEETSADGHLTVGSAVRAGAADAGVAIRAVALARGLESIPLAEEPYELVVPDHFLELPSVQLLLSTLRRPALGRQVAALGGYDVAAMGRPA